MDSFAIGADIATMATGLSVLTAAIVWTRRQYREWRERKVERERRGWQDYINPHSVNSWDVRLVVDPKEPTALVVLEVLNKAGGDPHPQQAQNLRQRVVVDGQLSRSPSPAERDFLIKLYSERKAGGGFEVR
jgi:hypothetical protein